MTTPRSSVSTVLALTCLAACSSSSPSGPGMGTGGSPGGGSTGVTTTGSGGSHTGGAGGGLAQPPPITVADRWPYRLDGDVVFRGPVFAALPALPAAGPEGAVAYVTAPSYTDAPWHLQVQRIDGGGTRIGSVISLATEHLPSWPVIAADGQRYIVCWSELDQVHCASQTPGQNVLTQIYLSPGVLPTVVHGGAGWLLAWRTSDEASAGVVLQKMKAPATARTPFETDGNPVTISLPGATAAMGHGARPLVAATETGFVLVGGAPVTAQWLDTGLQARGAAVDLGNPVINDPALYDGVVAATDTSLAFALAQPYAAVLTLVDAAHAVTTLSLNGGGKIGMRIGVCADDSTLAAFWPAWDSDNRESLVLLHPLTMLPPANPNGFSQQPVAIAETFMALARVGDQYFAALSGVIGEIEILSLGR